jgi:hypothetical protein
MQSSRSVSSVSLQFLAGLVLLATAPGTSAAAPEQSRPDRRAVTGWQTAQKMTHAGITGTVIVYLPVRYRAADGPEVDSPDLSD